MSETVLAAFQFDLHADDLDHNLGQVEAALRSAAAAGAQFVGLPEMWPTSFVDVGAGANELVERTEQALTRLEALSRELGLVVCGTAFAASTQKDRLYNRLHVVDGGRRVTSYDKVHLFSPTAEPWHFVAGKQPPEVVETSIGRVAGGTCYDLRFPELFRPAFRDGVQILCIPAQWPDARSGHWRSLVIARAIENQCFVVAVNRIGSVTIGRKRKRLTFPGNSLIVDPHGEVLAEGQGKQGLVTASIDLEVARQMRIHVPVEKDERPELYAQWESERVVK